MCSTIFKIKFISVICSGYLHVCSKVFVVLKFICPFKIKILRL